jgi:hypothetical protein
VAAADLNSPETIVPALRDVRGVFLLSGYQNLTVFADGTLDESPVTSTVHDVTGHQPRTFDQWAQDNADAFR